MSYPFYQNPNQFNPYQAVPQPQYQTPAPAPQYNYPQSQPRQGGTDERIWVQGEAGANAYIVAPNSFVRLWDSQKPIFYEKHTDSSGRPVTEVYEYSKKATPTESVAEIDQPNFKEQLDALERRISNIERMSKEANHDKRSNAKSILNDAEVQRVQK